jgi:hypothetical protein
MDWGLGLGLDWIGLDWDSISRDWDWIGIGDWRLAISHFDFAKIVLALS